jgi:hypothetical protein
MFLPTQVLGHARASPATRVITLEGKKEWCGSEAAVLVPILLFCQKRYSTKQNGRVINLQPKLTEPTATKIN